MYKKRFNFLLTLLLLTGCTVKESRDGSPCTLYVNSGDMCPLTVTLWNRFYATQAASSTEPATFEFTVERGDVIVTSGCAQTSYYGNGVFTLKDGVPVDSVYAWRDTLDCNWEWVRDTVCRCKQFATVNVKFNINPRHDRFPDSLRIISAWSGVEVCSFDAVSGAYGYTFPCTGTEQSFRVLRQGDDSLVLRLMRREKGVVDDVPLGQMLDRAGYSWSDESLRDININIEEAAIGLKVVILDWNTGVPMEIEI